MYSGKEGGWGRGRERERDKGKQLVEVA